jgi:UDP-N-acetylmuramate: L-alanyl-gamma-D-glutamyl-meso-diaminopimelate ligase
MMNVTGRKIHFSGIGGTGMVAGARLAVEAGWEVRGSDNPLYPPTSHMVAALGVPVAEGYAAENLDWNPDLVVIGNALSRGNAEVESILERGLHYVSLPEWLKDVVLRPRVPVAICGTHGKTTTTALTAFVLDRCGMNPGFLVGGQPADFPHSARLGDEGAPFVIEGDEYDTAFFDKRAKFFHYLPKIAVVTSIEFDHGDIYSDLAEIELAFERMLRQVPASGRLVACSDDAGASRLIEKATCPIISYGFGAEAELQGSITGYKDGYLEMDVRRKGALLGGVRLPLVGAYNAQNALAAAAVVLELGAEWAAIAEALFAFGGVRRRMEVFLEANDVVYVDDFAHHPTAIRETIRGARTRWPERRIWAVFEPRSNTTVTRAFEEPLAHELGEADRVVIGPTHRPERLPKAERLDRSALALALVGEDIPAAAPDGVDDIVELIQAKSEPGDLVLMLSNGSFGGIYDKLREALG